MVERLSNASEDRWIESPTKRKVELQKHLENLGLKQKSLKGKKILDLGCGGFGAFVKVLTREGVTAQAYGIDEGVVSGQEGFEGHFFQGDFIEGPLPVNECDLIVSEYAVNIHTNELFTTDERYKDAPQIVEKIITNIINALKSGGEARIVPITEVILPKDEVVRDYIMKFKDLIGAICKRLGVRMELKKVNVFEGNRLDPTDRTQKRVIGRVKRNEYLLILTKR